MSSDFERRGPAARARAEGRSYGVQLLPHPRTVRLDEAGRPRTPIAPYGAVVGACRLCPAPCCHHKVTVSLPDALHYAGTLRLPLGAGLTVVPSEQDEYAFRLDPDPRWPSDEPWAGRAELALKRGAGGRCHALLDVDGYARCGVYDARPSLCRTYPVRWTSDVAAGGPPNVHCPVSYGITDAHARELEQDIERSIEFWELHSDIVAAWNETTGPFTIEAFLAYAVPRTAQALEVDVPDALALGTPQERLSEAMQQTGIIRRPPGLFVLQPSTYAGLPRRQP